MDDSENDPRTYNIIGAAMRVHQELGPGFLEPVYQEAFEIEMELQGIPFLREVTLPVYYREKKLQIFYRADFICYENGVIVELKALSAITDNHKAQLINYLKATGIETGFFA